MNGNTFIFEGLDAPFNCPQRRGQLVGHILEIHTTSSALTQQAASLELRSPASVVLFQSYCRFLAGLFSFPAKGAWAAASRATRVALGNY